jgi:hypothetical protein
VTCLSDTVFTKRTIFHLAFILVMDTWTCFPKVNTEELCACI